MGKKEKKSPAVTSRERMKPPVNPSVRGTAKQAERTEKGGRTGPTGRPEGRGHPPGGGRGGKASRR